MTLPLPWFLSAIAARTAIVLLALLLGIRILGKRQMGGMNIFDLVLVLLLANAVQNAITNGAGNLGIGLASAGTLLVVDRALGILFVKRPWLETQLTGPPTILFVQGRLQREAMRREGVSEDEVLAAARSYGLGSLDEVRLAVLEADGSISIVPKREEASGEANQST